MLKEKEKLINNIIGIVEVIVTYITFFLALYIKTGSVYINQEYAVLLAFIGPIWFFLLRFYNISRVYRVNPYSYILLSYVIIFVIGMSLLFGILFALNLNSVSRVVMFMFAGINFVTLYLLKIDIYHIFKRYRKEGRNYINVLLVGDEELESIEKKIEENRYWGYRIAGIASDSEYIKEKYTGKYKMYPEDVDISTLIEENPIDEVIFNDSSFDRNKLTSIIYSCLEIGVVFRMSSQLLNVAKTKSSIQYLDEIPFFTFQNTPDNYISLCAKAVIDFVFSFFVIICLSPVYLIIAIIIKIDSRGPVFFKQTRVGLRGREFQVYKFRSMIPNAEKVLKDINLDVATGIENEQEGPVFKMKNDPRITKIGKFLRKTSLDELPQFFNVLKGDMSVVGPRPPIPSEVEQYERWQLRRLSMKPGITCIWQVSGRNNIPFHRWMKLDLQYIDTWSLKLDLMIVLKTIKTIIRRDGL